MTIKTFITLFFIVVYFGVAHSQADTKYAPSHYPIDSVEWGNICEPTYILDYYNDKAKNKKSSYQILKEWQSVFKKPDGFKQTGFLTVKFIINCRLELCCFHTFEMDDKYQPMAFDEDVKKQVIAFIKKLGDWQTIEYQDKPTNYCYYLNFVIKNGEFKRVSP